MAEANEQEQMKMAFMDDGMERDPISGNEIPTGSLAEEVRDDVPAMLSEGEYVVPADVLRFYGIKFFEDLRIKAKDGLARMESMGRIGGEPIEEEEEPSNVLPFPVEELETEEEEIEMAVGGYVEGGLEDGGSSGFRQVQYWNGQDEGTIFTATFIGDVSISHSPTQLENYVPYVSQEADDGEGSDEGDSSAPKETREERTRRRDKEKFRDRFEKQKEITEARYNEDGTRNPMSVEEIVKYGKQLQGYGPLNTGIDDIITKIPGIGNITSIMLDRQHKEILGDIQGHLYGSNKEGNKTELTEEEQKILSDMLDVETSKELGYTPAKSFLFKGKELVGDAFSKKKKDKESASERRRAKAEKELAKANIKYAKENPVKGADASDYYVGNKGGLMRKGKK